MTRQGAIDSTSSDEMCGRVPMHQCVPNVLQRDSRSIRDASPAAGAAKKRRAKGTPRCIFPGVFLFPGDHRRSPARQKELTTLPPTIPSTVRTVSVSQVGSRCSFYRPGISYFRRRRRLVVVDFVVVLFALLLAGGCFLDLLSRFAILSNNFI